MTSRLCNPEYYREALMEIRKYMEVREEGMEVQEGVAQLKTYELRIHIYMCVRLEYVY